jgi:membrane protease subunit HflK
MNREWIRRAPEEPGSEGGPAPAAPRRAGSMTLREGVQGPGENAMDPANQSLADALRVMMRLLQVGMVVLGVLYVLSGLQSVKEGERAIRLLFGKKVDENLEPGFRWSAPFPMGELVKVNSQYRVLDISKDFWIYIPAGAVDPSPEKQAPTASLKPDQGGSGSVITADGNVAHTKWRVGYERSEIGNFASNVLPEDEEKLVLSAVKRGVVQAVAQVTLDDLLQQRSVNGMSIPQMAQQIAQDTLKRLNSGLEIKALTMDPPIPPLSVKSAFNSASAAAANANRVIQEAQTYRSQQLNQTAGNAARYLVYYIDEYEHALAKGDQAGADATLTTVNSLLDGGSVEVLKLDDNGRPEVEETGQPTGRKVTLAKATTGDVASTLNSARLYKTGVVSRAKSDAARYEAKLEQYKANPSVMVQREWTDALKAFMARPNVTMQMMPPGVSTLTLLINQDPDVQREIEAFIKEEQRKAAEKKRLEDLQRIQNTTSTTVELHG